MSLAIAGMGWVTPLGRGVDSVWEQLLHGDEASATAISEEFGNRPYHVFRVPESALTGLAHPRLRRASLISRFAAAAGLDALRAAGVKLDPQNAERTALIFAIANGGVIYTKRFYRDVVDTGAQSASPLLFPETVFNAPASHLAAILGVTGATYTLVGDGTVGLAAIKMAEDLMANEPLDHCLVVGTEEVDWLSCDAYRRWRLLRLAPPIEPFNEQQRGMILSEGAGAIVLARDGPFTIECAHPGGYFTKRAEAEEILKRILRDLSRSEVDLVIASANGTFVDEAECRALKAVIPNVLVYTGKPALGESVGAAGLWQIILAAQALRSAELPPVLHADPAIALRVPLSRTPMTGARRAIVLSCGLNQQAAGLRLAHTSH
jgi:3-oxoacyl-(acyl-carrier-protein) synthase